MDKITKLPHFIDNDNIFLHFLQKQYVHFYQPFKLLRYYFYALLSYFFVLPFCRNVRPSFGHKTVLKTSLLISQSIRWGHKCHLSSDLNKTNIHSIMYLQNQICNNQIRRMDEENKRLHTQMEEKTKHQDNLEKQIKTLLRKMDDLQTQVG